MVDVYSEDQKPHCDGNHSKEKKKAYSKLELTSPIPGPNTTVSPPYCTLSSIIHCTGSVANQGVII